MHANLDWQRFFDIAARDISFDEKLEQYAKIALEHFEAEQVEEFCDKHLAHLDEVAHEFFGSDVVMDAIQQKVTALYPEHEIEQFSNLFWDRIQTWRQESVT
jgi:hypothetical protein